MSNIPEQISKRTNFENILGQIPMSPMIPMTGLSKQTDEKGYYLTSVSLILASGLRILLFSPLNSDSSSKAVYIVYRCMDRSGSQGNDENPRDTIFPNLLFSNPFTGFVARAPDAVGPILVTEEVSQVNFRICLGQIFTYFLH